MGCTSSKAAEANDPSAGTAQTTSAAKATPAAAANVASAPAPGSSSRTATSQTKPAASETKLEARKSSDKTAVASEAAPSRLSIGSSGPPSEGNQLREATEKPKIIFVIGGPGSGKGTQCAKIMEKYGGGVRHISSGDLLRAEVSKGSELGQELEKTMKSGALVSDDQVIKLLEKEISASAWFGMAWLVDGFPRAVPQAKKFEIQIREADLVLYFECPEEVMKERIMERGKTSGRQDDNEKTVKERILTFKKQSLPVTEYYSERDKLRTISAVPPPEEVYKEVAVILEEYFEGSDGKTKTKREEVDQWRTPQVLDMQKRFYGGLQDEEIETIPAEGPISESLPPLVKVS